MSSDNAPDPYAVMHLAPDCTDEDVKAQWRHFARAFHPDSHAGDPWFEEEFKKIEAAYEVLGHPERRAAYDQERQFREPMVLETRQVEVSAVTYSRSEPARTLLQIVDEDSPETAKRRAKLVLAAIVVVLTLMMVSLVRAVRGAHPAVPDSAQEIDGSAIVAPAFERSADPETRSRQDALQSRLAAAQPAIDQLIGDDEQTLTALESQDRIDAQSNPAWTHPLDRQRDEAALQADISELRFQMADIEQQIDQMGTPAGADQESIEQEMESLEAPHQSILGDIALAEHDLRSEASPR